jgi:hypothetical protein
VTLLFGDTGKVSLGTFKKYTFTYPGAREDNSSLNIGYGNFQTALPTAQDATVGATFTIEESDLPIISGNPPIKYTAFVVVSGINNSGATAIVLHQPFKNGISQNGVATLTNITTTNKYWAVTTHRFFDVVVGDILNVKVYANNVGVSFDYCAMWIIPTQPKLSPKGTFMKDFANVGIYYPDSSTIPLNTPPTGGAIAMQTPGAMSFYTGSGSVGNFSLGQSLNGGLNFASGFDYLYRVAQGDTSINHSQGASATTRNINRAFTPDYLYFREISL